jgi:hypothetical protein
MALHYSLFPVEAAGSGAGVPLAPAPGLVPATSAAEPDPVRTFRFGDVVSFGPPVQRLDQNGYLTLELRISTVDTVTGTITPLDPAEVKSMTPDGASVRVGVGVFGIDPLRRVLYPSNSIGDRLSPNDTFLDILANWIQIGKQTAATAKIADFLVQFDAGVFRIHIDAADNWAGGQIEEVFNLEIVIQNKLSRPLSVVFTASDATIADTSLPASNLQPWVHIDAGLNLGNLATNTGSGAVNVYNFGTGLATISGSVISVPPVVPPLPPPFAIDASGTLTNGSTLNPGSSGQLGFAVTPQPGQTAGKAQGLFTLASDGNAESGHVLHNNELSLQADIGLLEVMLVLDGSGSMAWNGDASNLTPPIGERRWDKLREGAVGFLSMLFAQTTATATRVRVGAVVFPKITPPQDIFGKEVLFPVSDLTPTFIDDFDGRFEGPSALVPQGWTPMGEGLIEAVNQLTGGPNDHQAIVIVSDGASNVGTPPATVDISTAEDRFAILYGTDSGINRDILIDVVDEANVIDGLVPPSSPDPLGQALSKVAANVVGLEGTEDPPGFVTSINPVAVHDFRVTELDRDVTIWIGWQRFDRRRLTIELISPRCELVRPRSTEAIWQRTGNTHQVIFLPENYLRGSGPDDSRYGNWRLVVRLGDGGSDDRSKLDDESPPSSGQIDREDYSYNIYTKTRLALELELGTGDGVLQTGAPLRATAILKINGIPVRSASPVLEIRRPSASLAQFLASTVVSPDTFGRVRKEMEAQGVTEFWTIKTLALEADGKAFAPNTETLSVPLTERSPGVYELGREVIARIPGSYKLRLVARGELSAGVPFRREIERDLSVKASVSPEHTTLDVQHDLKACTARVTLRPRDAFGNPVLFDPKVSPLLTLQVRGGGLVGELEVQLDGSYTQTLKISPKLEPVIDVVLDGKVVLSRGVPVPFGLIWADRVLSHVPGDEKKANAHPDPKVLLGPFEDHGKFLSLGAQGSVTVGVERRRIVPKSVTVFVRPDRDLRAYKVEALVPDEHNKSATHAHALGTARHACWVEIGRSEGITQSFNLPKRGDASHPSVRITDLSGRSIARPGEPLKTPGVSIQAVGFRGRSSK